MYASLRSAHDLACRTSRSRMPTGKPCPEARSAGRYLCKHIKVLAAPEDGDMIRRSIASLTLLMLVLLTCHACDLKATDTKTAINPPCEAPPNQAQRSSSREDTARRAASGAGKHFCALLQGVLSTRYSSAGTRRREWKRVVRGALCCMSRPAGRAGPASAIHIS